MAGWQRAGLKDRLRALVLALITVMTAVPAAAQAQNLPAEFLRAMAMRSQPAPQAITAIVRYVDAARLAPPIRAEIELLLQGARADLEAGNEATAMAKLAQARARLNGREWTVSQAFASSLDIRIRSPFVSAGQPVELAIVQTFPAAELPATLRLSAVIPGVDTMQLGTMPIDLRDELQVVRMAAPALEGRGQVRAEIIVGGEVLATIDNRADFVPDLAALEAQSRMRLAQVEASEAAKAVVLYPFELAHQIEAGEREVEARPFSDRLKRSREVLAALEQGRDIVYRAVGDQDRAYRFPETGELIPYRIHVPRDWNGESLPLIVALHGGGGDENGMLELDDGKFGKLADRYGYIVVSPLGYRPLGAYGSPIRLPSVYGSNTPEGRAVGGPERAQLLQRSERDVLNVLSLVIEEYGADRDRLYLTGHSMGGGGTWYLAHQYPELWDAVAPSAGPFFIDGYDFERLRGMGVMIVQGSGDPPSLHADRQLAIDLLSMGIGVNYLETPSVNHGQTFGASLPSIFEFFERQKLREHPDRPLPWPE